MSSKNCKAPDFTPARLWHYIEPNTGLVADIPITPAQLHRAIMGDRLSNYVINNMVAVIETAKAINRAMGKYEKHGL